MKKRKQKNKANDLKTVHSDPDLQKIENKQQRKVKLIPFGEKEDKYLLNRQEEVEGERDR